MSTGEESMGSDVQEVPAATTPKKGGKKAASKKAAPKKAAPAPKAGKPVVKTTARTGKSLLSKEQLTSAAKIANSLKTLGDKTRVSIIMMLTNDEQHVGALCDSLEQSQPAVSHHLALLRHGGIVMPRRQGKNNFYGLTEKGEELSRVIQAAAS